MLPFWTQDNCAVGWEAAFQASLPTEALWGLCRGVPPLPHLTVPVVPLSVGTDSLFLRGSLLSELAQCRVELKEGFPELPPAGQAQGEVCLRVCPHCVDLGGPCQQPLWIS